MAAVRCDGRRAFGKYSLGLCCVVLCCAVVLAHARREVQQRGDATAVGILLRDRTASLLRVVPSHKAHQFRYKSKVARKQTRTKQQTRTKTNKTRPNKQTGQETNRQKQANKQTHKQTNKQTNKHRAKSSQSFPMQCSAVLHSASSTDLSACFGTVAIARELMCPQTVVERPETLHTQCNLTDYSQSSRQYYT